MLNFKDLPVSDLDLDRQNPRLPSQLKGAGEPEILKYLARKTNIAELITSIGENNFFPGEAIVVTQSEAPAGRYIVIEGNRRLTALKLLGNASLAHDISKSAGDAVDNAKYHPITVPAYEVDSRYDTLQYLGFRHISGVQRWDPLAKARYLKMLYQHTSGGPESRYRNIASEIGSRRDTVRKNLDALAVYELTEREQFFNIPMLSEERFQFGVFYTALANPRIAEFTGARDANGPTHPIENPESLKISEIGEIVQWMFAKDADGNTKLGESRNIPKLAAVVSAPSALQRFREGEPLDIAHLDTPDVQEEFIREIRTAIHHVKLANTKLSSIQVNNADIQSIVREMQVVTKETLDAIFHSSPLC